ncbi:hypothetical protein J2X65_001955 [Ancylobacter sp. 3268]|uniref:hypothetical protein n=1 Tax=Ancylobacter sp. 3268 TaxID=2817752 RepID=UPI0028657588|nr:hypothetical protein [Ancylobacter sp. 3268]MDR6952600.1 hypothetical protein [Ancylobacter sp. 3268]
MKTYLISYDLLKPGADYTRLFDAIKAIANGYWHCLDSVWLINTVLSAAEIRDVLIKHIDANDKLLVILQGNDWATYNIPANGNEWLKKHSNLIAV